MIKVLHIVTRLDIGGISTLLYNYYHHIDKSKILFHIVAIDTGFKHGLHEAFECMGVKVFYMPQRIDSRFMFLWKLIRRERYDIVHSHIEVQSGIYLLLAKLAGGKKSIAHAHLSRSNLGFKNIVMQFILNKVVSLRLGASDLALKSVFGEKYLSKGRVLNNAIDVEKFAFNESARVRCRREFGLEDNFVIGFVGRLSAQKNIDFLIDVFIAYHQQNDKARLLVVGDGEDAYLLQEKLQSKGVFEKLIWLKSRNDVHYLLNAIDIILLPSHYEGLPLVLVETQANSLQAIVSTKVTKLVELTSYIAYLPIDNREDIEKWCDKILNYEKGYLRRSTLRELTESGFNIKIEAENLLRLYTDLSTKK